MADDRPEEVRRFERGRCPLCNGLIYRLVSSWFCPNEDAHVGGLIIYSDGSYRLMSRTNSIR